MHQSENATLKLQPYGYVIWFANSAAQCGESELELLGGSENLSEIWQGLGISEEEAEFACIEFAKQVILKRDQWKMAGRQTPGRFFCINSLVNIDFSVLYRFIEGFHFLEIFKKTNSRNAIAAAEEEVLNTRLNFASCESIAEIATKAVQSFASLFSCDRALVYKFEPNQDGVVIAEADSSNLPQSFLGLRFPGIHFPAEARTHFRSCLVRAVFSVEAPNTKFRASKSEIENFERTAQLFNSCSLLREVDPCHLEYLRNMGLGASFSVALIVEDELWGLVVCHFAQNFEPPLSKLLTAETFAEIVSAQIAQVLVNDRYKLLQAWNLHRCALLETDGELSALSRRLPDTSDGKTSFVRAFLELAPSVLDFLRADAAAYCVDGTIHNVGAVPETAEFRDLLSFVSDQEFESCWHSDCLSAHVKSFRENKNFCGVFILVLQRKPFLECLVIFRIEELSIVEWAGNPHADGSKVHGTPNKQAQAVALHASFVRWQELRTTHSAPWSKAEQDLANELRKACIELRFYYLMLSESREKGRAETVALILHDLGNQMTGVYGWAAELARDLLVLQNQPALRKQEIDNESAPLRKDESALLSIVKRFLPIAIGHSSKLLRSIEVSNELLQINQRLASKGVVDHSGVAHFSIEQALADLPSLLPLRYRGDTAVFELDLQGLSNVRVCFDRSRFIRIVLSLLKNSLEAAEVAQRTPKALLKAFVQKQSLVVELTDNGIGWDDSEQWKLFAEYPSSGSVAGDLTVLRCRALLEAYGGTLELSSEGRFRGAKALLVVPLIS